VDGAAGPDPPGLDASCKHTFKKLPSSLATAQGPLYDRAVRGKFFEQNNNLNGLALLSKLKMGDAGLEKQQNSLCPATCPKPLANLDLLPFPMIVRFCNPYTITVSPVFWWLIFPVFELRDTLGKEFLSLTIDPLEGTPVASGPAVEARGAAGRQAGDRYPGVPTRRSFGTE